MASSSPALDADSRLVVAVAGSEPAGESRGASWLTAAAGDGLTGVIHDEASTRFTIRASSSGKDVAFVEYAIGASAGPGSSTLDLFHTFSDPEQRGKGLAGKVVEAALGWCRAHGARAVPTCSYVSHFVAKHPEWQPVTKAPEVRTVAPGGSGAAASSASLPSVGAAEPAPCSHEDHIFGLSYGQYACKVYARGMAATEVTPGLGRLRADADPVLACRMAALCARRATELDDRSSSSAADGARTADSLRLEAAHVLTVLAAEAPDMDWVGPRTAGVVDDLEMRGFLLGFKDRAVGGAGEDGDGGAAKRAKPAGDDAEDE